MSRPRFRPNYFSSMRAVLKFPVCIALFFLPLSAGVVFDLQGRVPPAVAPEFLKSNYERIWKAVAPDGPADTSVITVIYYSKSDRRRLGVRLPEWGGGGAIGRDTIIVPVDRFALADMGIGQVTVHELVHIALERAWGRLRIPRWLHEGLAMTLSGELSFEEQLALSRAILAKRLMPLDSVERVNRFDRFGAALAYSQSHLAVSFMIDRYGMEGVRELLAAVRPSGGFDAALEAEFGFSQEEFDAMVRAFIVDRYRFLFFLGDTWLLWTGGALLAVAGFVSVKRRNRRRQKQMEEEEKAAAAAVSGAQKENPKRITLDEVLDDFGEDKD